MSCAPPPPPPPAAPSLPVFTSPTKSNSKDERSQLLDSIRKGTKLKKTITNDKSAPAIGGNTSAKSSSNINNVATTRTTTTNGRQGNDVPPPVAGGLGGLFINGIPKLKPTGSAIGQAYQQYRNESDSPKSNVLVNGRGGNHVNSHVSSLISKTRGPPPQPPGAAPKTLSFQPDIDSQEGLAAHSRSISAISLNENTTTKANGYQNRTSNGGPNHVISHGKPSVAPKPPGVKVFAKTDGRSSVVRAQSMRLPRSPLSTTEIKNGPQFPDYSQPELPGINNKNGLPSFHQSQESLSRRSHRPSSPSRTPWSSVSMNNVNATLRPYNRSHGSPLRPPSSKPPPPPPTRVAVNPPMCPPPPPPTQPPPPPPHRINPAPPPPPSVIQNRPNNHFLNSGAPPTPPTRNSSIRTSNTNSFESRFFSLFHSVDEFPPPQPFESVDKIYNSRIHVHKQQAPQPPNRVWQQCENTSNC